MLPLALIILSYLLGSISSAVIVSRLFGLPDPRSQGSGNPGATNVLRLGGRKAAAITLLGDMLKGVIPVLIARALDSSADVVAACALATFLGHLFPVFFRLRGGKGVATMLGALLALSWQAGLLTIATWLAVAAVTRISSLSALVAALFAPVYIAWRLPGEATLMAVIVMVSLLFWRHRGNIRNLLNGTEGKMGGKQ